MRTDIFSGTFGSASSRTIYIVTNRRGGKKTIAGLLVKLIKLNNLQYNPNRDPEVCWGPVNEPFRIQSLLDGAGEALCRLSDAKGQPIAEKTVALPGTFTHEIAFDTPGTRIVTLTIEGNGQRYTQNLRLDVMEHAWVG